MSNKPTPATATEPNREGLPLSPERGTGEPLAASPVVAGTGVQGVVPEAVLESEQKPAGKANKPTPATATEPKKAKSAVGWYRVTGPGHVKINGVWQKPGDEIKVPHAEALSVDGCVEPIDGPTEPAAD